MHPHASRRRQAVQHSPPAGFELRVELITDTAGHLLTGGSGMSGWGYNQSNIVRHNDDVYALSWRDDLTLVVFRRVSEHGKDARASWEQGPVLPPVPQNGNLLVDSIGRLHVVAGEAASWHVVFDQPGSLECWELRSGRQRAGSRFGATIDEKDRIFVAGGLDEMGWMLLDGATGFTCMAQGRHPNDAARGYQFVALRDGQAHTLCSDDWFLPGRQYPNQVVRLPDPATGGTKDIETPHGIYPVLRAYYLYNPNLIEHPTDWRCAVVADITDTFDERTGARGSVDHQELFIDRAGYVHLLWYENRQPARSVWASAEQDPGNSRLYHAIGLPGGPFDQVFELGNYNSGRLYETPDGRLHYLMTRGPRGSGQSVWYAVSRCGEWGTISEPQKLPCCGPLHHLFVNSSRAGGTCGEEIDLYWTGATRPSAPSVVASDVACSQNVYYGRLTPHLDGKSSAALL